MWSMIENPNLKSAFLVQLFMKPWKCANRRVFLKALEMQKARNALKRYGLFYVWSVIEDSNL